MSPQFERRARIFRWQATQFFRMEVLYDGYETQEYRRLADSFCRRVAAYNRQRKDRMRTAGDQIVLSDYHKLLYQKSQKRNRVLRGILIILTYNVNFFLYMRDDDY